MSVMGNCQGDGPGSGVLLERVAAKISGVRNLELRSKKLKFLFQVQEPFKVCPGLPVYVNTLAASKVTDATVKCKFASEDRFWFLNKIYSSAN